MVTWEQFEQEAPEIASAGKRILYQYGAPVAYLATVRKDSGPRIHPICPAIASGSLLAFIGPSHKRDDLLRDGRYAMHTFRGKAWTTSF